MNVTSLAKPHSLSAQSTLARHQLRQLLAEMGWRGEVEPVLLAVHEALVNAQCHGGGIHSVSAGMEGSTLVVEVCDVGRGFELRAGGARRPDPMSERGRGLWIIERVASSAEVRREGDLVCLHLRFDEP